MDSASGRLSAALLLTKNKGRDTIIKKNVKPEGSVPPWKIRGGTKSAPDRHALSHAVYVSDEEEKLLHEAAAEGIEVFIQAVPSDAKKILT